MSNVLVDRVPLVLLAAAVRRVSVEDPALRVISLTCADQWFPLGRLSELRCHGPVPLAGDVVPSCLRLGITVQWFGTSCEWLGLAVPAVRASEDSIERALMEFLELPDWQTRLVYFIAAEERQLMLRFLAESGLRVAELRAEPVRARAQTMLQQSAHLSETLLESLRQSMLAKVSAAWISAGLPAALISRLPQQLSLPATLARLADWELLRVLWQLRHRLDRIWRLPAQRLTFIESNLPDAERLVAAWVRKFRTWIEQQARL